MQNSATAFTPPRPKPGIADITRICANPGLDSAGRIDALLELGLDACGLSIGVVSQIQGTEFHVLHARSPEGAIEAGMVFDLRQTFCADTWAADEPVSMHRIGSGAFAGHPCYQAFRLESYIATPLLVAGRRFGTLSLSCPQPRAPFEDEDRTFVAMLAAWISQELAQAERDAEDKARRAAGIQQRRLVDALGHDIRSPMNVAMGLAQLLSLADLAPKPAGWALRLGAALDDLMQLLTTVQTLAEDADEAPPLPEAMAPTAFLAGLDLAWRTRFNLAGGRLAVGADGPLPEEVHCGISHLSLTAEALLDLALCLGTPPDASLSLGVETGAIVLRFSCTGCVPAEAAQDSDAALSAAADLSPSARRATLALALARQGATALGGALAEDRDAAPDEGRTMLHAVLPLADRDGGTGAARPT